ncbi:MAG: hypothetical protein HN742_24410 [Lentisphaerae bacterium]|jgi:hypothetical protein|nr:hypothetical protein [Lentisphaerota bacterium]MBT7056576.1 hypothetical protein [Lentisphaerota bacterium]MBT7845043.1 hypothetical protein [Lentisphaerota bacterium]
MGIGPIILLVWFLLMISSIATGIVMAVVRGVGSLKWSAQTVLGTLLYYGFISAGLGVSEGVWTATSPGLLIALAVGGAGVALTIVGIRGLVRTRTADGQDGRTT